MSENLFDMRVRIYNLLTDMELEGKHPSDMNAFVYGVITGMNFGVIGVTCGIDYSEELGKVLSDSSKTIQEIMKNANTYLPENEAFFYPIQFNHLAYRNSLSKESYAEGIRLGFEYTFLLFEALSKPVDRSYFLKYLIELKAELLKTESKT